MLTAAVSTCTSWHSIRTPPSPLPPWHAFVLHMLRCHLPHHTTPSFAVQATGHHSGGPLVMPGLEPLPASGKHFCLTEEVQKVKVQGSKVVEIQVRT